MIYQLKEVKDIPKFVLYIRTLEEGEAILQMKRAVLLDRALLSNKLVMVWVAEMAKTLKTVR